MVIGQGRLIEQSSVSGFVDRFADRWVQVVSPAAPALVAAAANPWFGVGLDNFSRITDVRLQAWVAGSGLAPASLERGSEHPLAAAILRAAKDLNLDLAEAADFGFLYHRKRHLLHIGYRVAEQQLDASFYDLLAVPRRATLDEIVAVTLLSSVENELTLKLTLLRGEPASVTGAPSQASEMPRLLLCSTLSKALPR